jgi:hypothetical protein
MLLESVKPLFSNGEINNTNPSSFLWAFTPQECGVQFIATHKLYTIRASNKELYWYDRQFSDQAVPYSPHQIQHVSLP